MVLPEYLKKAEEETLEIEEEEEDEAFVIDDEAEDDIDTRLPRWNGVSNINPFANERSFGPIAEDDILSAQNQSERKEWLNTSKCKKLKIKFKFQEYCWRNCWYTIR